MLCMHYLSLFYNFIFFFSMPSFCQLPSSSQNLDLLSFAKSNHLTMTSAFSINRIQIYQVAECPHKSALSRALSVFSTMFTQSEHQISKHYLSFTHVFLCKEEQQRRVPGTALVSKSLFLPLIVEQQLPRLQYILP